MGQEKTTRPEPLDEESAELNDEQLEGVSGGIRRHSHIPRDKRRKLPSIFDGSGDSGNGASDDITPR